MHIPRIAISGLSGDAGKTVISVGLGRVWTEQRRVILFKKGPDYIDMAWLALAAGHPCYNLDLFFIPSKQLYSSFLFNATKGDVAIIEGNRGLYDGLDVKGSVSTAEVAKFLQVPVILIVNCTKVTRTTAALVLGCLKMDPAVPIRGVILNQLARARHEEIIKACIDKYCHLPVVGAIPRLKDVTFPGRHLGLVPPQEHPQAAEAIETAATIVKKYLDLNKIWEIATQVPPLKARPEELFKQKPPRGIKIGVIRDSAFQFYYPENIEALAREGAEVVEFSALQEKRLPAIDALYIGGGFPETHAEQLAANVSLRKEIKEAAEEGLPIYAECGGLMYLCKELIWQGKKYPMVGIFPTMIGVSKRPQGHGYTIAEVKGPNPYFPVGQVLKGHEFHYSYVLEWKETPTFAFTLKKGYGVDGKHDGLCYKNVLAAYTHLHALGAENWASALVEQAVEYRKRKCVEA
ncbi:MAG: hydrogenobyrinic acid a,c-diamide synthase (glutamine-hydrolyzing) [Candidatus Desulfofervidaceae bacterium]|nr:hydrogenobyrinic acid a,c-diamide synthase (glutamine-hydrolyzing) [Candidatus Desulfofervidaceae bacterium]